MRKVTPNVTAGVSHLSKYGRDCLSKKKVDEKDIYEKQERKYNIISILPKTHNETIKKYPKFRLENSDENYQRTLQLQKEQRRQRTLNH